MPRVRWPRRAWTPIAPSGTPLAASPHRALWYASARVSVGGVNTSPSDEHSVALESASRAHFHALIRSSSPHLSIHSRERSVSFHTSYLPTLPLKAARSREMRACSRASSS